jgi:hypothetical protein
VASEGRETKRRRRYGWTTPRWKDKAFLAAVGLTVALVALQGVLVSDRFTTFWYLNIAIRAVFTWILISAVIRIRVGIQRGLVGGFRESQEKAAERDTTSTADTIARASGRTVGRAIAAYKKTQGKPPT